MSAASPVGRTIRNGAATTALGFAIRFGARILFLYVAARLFGVALFGSYSLAVASIELAVTVAGLGFKRLLFKHLDEATERPPSHVVLDSAVAVLTASLLLATVLVLAAVLLPPSVLAPRVAIGLIALAPMIAGQALLDLVSAATRWKRVLRYEVVGRSVIEPYVGVAAAFAAHVLGWQETGLLIGYWAGTLAALAYASMGMRRCYGGLGVRAYRVAPGRLLQLIRTSTGATLNDLLNGLFGRVDLYLVGFFLGEVGAGVYAMARQIRTPVRQVRQSFDALLNPIIARTIATRGPERTGLATAAASRLILAVQLPIVITLALIGEPLLAWFGPGFVAAYWAMLVLAAAESIQGAMGVSDLIILYHRPLSSLRITTANIVCNVAAGCLLMGPFGVTGAAMAVLVGVTAGALLRRLTLRRSFGVTVPVHHSVGPLLTALVAAAAALAARELAGGASTFAGEGVALAVGLLGYAAGLKIWMATAGEDWSLSEFEPDSAAPLRS